MTVAQRDALAAELAELEGPKRAEMVEAIATARGFGDLSENFAYHDAKNEQGLLERRITILRSRVENAVIVEHAEDGVVGVGSVVEVEDEQRGRFEVEISSVAAASRPTRRSGRRSSARRSATRFEVQAPKGAWTARVVSSVRSGSVEAALGLVEALGASVSTASAARATSASASSSGANGREHVVGDRPTVAAAGAADADARPQEVGRAERLPDRAEAVVAPEPSTEPDLQPARLEIDVVVHDRDRARWGPCRSARRPRASRRRGSCRSRA